ncbi:mechanosensitive ion channel family protein [Marixanthomonas sp. SCSIO 43207]|uniref:mechanosensitive ion channel family protein n=1 Tax=Marixanthomonas sp. SCSIO 43207 TaxID=2779360 RepID=UPI001CA967D9|nr:mechanosensitive ion channel family protein [Marixanthomonas sp. SCSIO 43207]UAB81064.1 mechanosensitive ion channel family protein [Marixanthomonas sp. SCSIO 43207]
MKQNIHFLTSLFILLFFGNLNISAQSEQDSVKPVDESKLPSKKRVIEDSAYFASNPFTDYNEAYYQVNRLNDQVGLPPKGFNLRTPQAALEHFVLKSRSGKYDEALFALNLNLLPQNTSKEDAAILAEKLYFVINQRVNIDWDALSDRPDGQIDISTTTNQAIAGKPRRSVVFGEVQLGERDIVMRVQRIRYKEYGALWLISANTVENIEDLYQEYGPRKLDKMMPEWSRVHFLGFQVWKFLGIALLLVMAWFFGKLVTYLLRKILRKSKRNWIKHIANKLAKPAGILFGTLFFYILLDNLISLSGGFANIVYTTLIVLIIGSITWFITRFVDYLMTYIAENKIGDVSEEENEEARKMLTYISVARRIVTFLVVVIGGYIIISQFRALEKVGISLLASAGVATVILGIAAQNTLGNIFAGLQIAITKPVRVGDTVIINDDWGNVEEIGFTYMVVRTWDLRRLVVPLKYVISNIFENWSMTSSHQIRPIILYADYRVDVSKIRSEFEKLLKNEDDWDQENPAVVEVVDMTEESVKLRALCSAKDAKTTWQLHCSLREKLVAYISQLEDGIYLSRTRVDISTPPHEKDYTDKSTSGKKE